MLIFMFFSTFLLAKAAKLHISRQRYYFFRIYASARLIFLQKKWKSQLFQLSFPLQISIFDILFLHKRSLQALRDIDHIVAHMLELVDNIDVIHARLVVLIVVLQRLNLCLTQFVA